MQKNLKKFDDAGLKVIAISYDSVDVLAKFADQNKITFPLLSDPDSQTIAAYGLTNKEEKGQGQGTPYPGTYVLDKDGVVRAKLFRQGVIARHTPDELLKAAEVLR